jgi:hypothetical protein
MCDEAEGDIGRKCRQRRKKGAPRKQRRTTGENELEALNDAERALRREGSTEGGEG